MPVTEQLMKPGGFDISLDPSTPKFVRSALVEFGHIVVYDTPLDPRFLADGDALVNALYVGVMRRKPTPLQLSGAGLVTWLGDEEGKASPLYSFTLAAGQTFVQLVTTVVSGPVALGTLTAIAGTLGAANNTNPVSYRAALDFLMTYFGGEYRVHTDVTNKVVVDAGPSSAIFSTTPKVIATPGESSREPSGLIGISASAFPFSLDADSYAYGVDVQGSGGPGTLNGVVRFSTPYKDLRGGAYGPAILLQSPITGPGNEGTMATGFLAQHDLRKTVQMISDRYALSRDIKAGDWLYLFDPANDVFDTSNQVVYRGEMINPLALRAFSITWPVEEGMSVWYRDKNGIYTDLTRYIEFEAAGTTFEVGAPIRGLTVP